MNERFSDSFWNRCQKGSRESNCFGRAKNKSEVKGWLSRIVVVFAIEVKAVSPQEVSTSSDTVLLPSMSSIILWSEVAGFDAGVTIRSVRKRLHTLVGTVEPFGPIQSPQSQPCIFILLPCGRSVSMSPPSESLRRGIGLDVLAFVRHFLPAWHVHEKGFALIYF